MKTPIFLGLFGAERIDFKHIESLANDAPELIVWAAPIMFFFVLLEFYFSRKENKNFYTKKETFASICVGVGNVIISFFLKFTLFFLVICVYNMVPWRISFSWWTIIPCYLILDFCSYWSHRISHIQRFWWATHVVHHSAEDYNLTVSFRLSWIQHLKIVFFLPLAICGFHPVIFFVANQIAVLFQFWVHTEYIGKLHPLIELIFATPSNHRVHHGSQEKYINKNFGATFIFWDRLFGTYVPESVKPVYGLTHQLKNKSNPFYINFHEMIDMWHDVRKAKGIRKKMFFLFGNPIEIAREKNKILGEGEQVRNSVRTSVAS